MTGPGRAGTRISDGQPLGDDVLGQARGLRVAGDGSEEVVALQRQQLSRLEGADGRGAGYVAEQPDLAEELPRALDAEQPAVLGDLHRAGPDQVEPVRALTLDQDRLAL